MKAETFTTRIHKIDGQTEEYVERGDTPQSLEVIRDRRTRYPSGARDFWQHHDGALYEQPPQGGA